ncbi:MAG: signal peptidase II [Anaerolineae bacterium]
MRRWAALLVPAILIFSLDQAIKTAVRRTLSEGEFTFPIPALSEVFGITFSQNRGAAFSLLPQAGDLFLIVALLMTIGILVFYRRVEGKVWAYRIALGLVLGGTSGNALDRILWGYVIDWFYVRIPGVLSNVSNTADHAIVIGIGVLLILSWGKDEVRPKSNGLTGAR